MNPKHTSKGHKMERYFAYGSNMNPKRMKSRVGGFNDRSYGVLPSFALDFSKRAYSKGIGYANVVADTTDAVEGVIYTLTTEQIEKLDGFEGVSSGQYKREKVRVFMPDNTPVKAWCYFAKNTGTDLKPTKDYLSHLIVGAKNFLSDAYVQRLQNQPTRKVVYPKIPTYKGGSNLKQASFDLTSSYIPAKYRVREVKEKIEGNWLQTEHEKKKAKRKKQRQTVRDKRKVINSLGPKYSFIDDPKIKSDMEKLIQTPMRVFVYGTLKQGYGNNRLMTSAKSWEPAMVNGEIYDCGIPFVTMKQEKVSCYATGNPKVDVPAFHKAPFKKFDDYADTVFGEIYEFENWEALKSLDRLEGFSPERNNNLYERALVTTKTVRGNELKLAWIYLAPSQKENRFGGRKIFSGTWGREYRHSVYS